jgi:hypothetical protein
MGPSWQIEKIGVLDPLMEQHQCQSQKSRLPTQAADAVIKGRVIVLGFFRHFQRYCTRKSQSIQIRE